jgi:hypothetical protein
MVYRNSRDFGDYFITKRFWRLFYYVELSKQRIINKISRALLKMKFEKKGRTSQNDHGIESSTGVPQDFYEQHLFQQLWQQQQLQLEQQQYFERYKERLNRFSLQ